MSRHVSRQSRCIEATPTVNGRKICAEIWNAAGSQFSIPRTYGRYESWQATVHYLEAADVVSAVRLK